MKLTDDMVGYGTAYNYGSMTLGYSDATLQIYSGMYTPEALWVYGDIFVEGMGTSLGGWVTSDKKLKKNIQSLNGTQILNEIQKISGKKYQIKDREELIRMHENKQLRFRVDTIDLEVEKENLMDEYGSVSDSILQQKIKYDKTITVDGKQYGLRILAPDLSGRERYGLIAQEIKDEFPELVKYDSTRMRYAINYDGFIPVLLETVKAQQKQIDTVQQKSESDQSQLIDQQQRIADLEQLVQQQQNTITSLRAQVDTILAQCCSSLAEPKSNPTGTLKVNEAPQAELYQNIPNPFTESTRIEYFLPGSTGKARLYIYNMQGAQIENFIINTMGEGSITIQGGSMQPGMYMYTLIADNRVVDTKRMILTK